MRYRRARTDYPTGVVATYDNGGKTIDRYTVVFEPYPLPYPYGLYDVGAPVFEYLTMSGNPRHPQGFCQHGEVIGRRPAGGRVIRFSDLPPDCQTVVLYDLEGEGD